MQSQAIFAESEFKRRRSHQRDGVGAAAMTIRRQRASTSCRLDQGLDLLRHQQREIAMYKNHGLRWLPGAKSREFLVKTAPLILGPGTPSISYRCRSEERHVGKECVSKLRSRWSPSH